MDELAQKINTAGSPCMDVEDNFTGRMEDSGSENYQDNQSYSFMVLKKCDYADAGARQLAIEDTRAMVFKILSRIKKDYSHDHQGGYPATGLRNFDWNSLYYQTVGQIGRAHV